MTKVDKFVKSSSGLSFRVKREILISTAGEILLQPIEKIRFLPAVEMTDPHALENLNREPRTVNCKPDNLGSYDETVFLR